MGLTEKELAYTAGIVDGEGSICINKVVNGKYKEVKGKGQLRSYEQEALEEAQAILLKDLHKGIISNSNNI